MDRSNSGLSINNKLRREVQSYPSLPLRDIRLGRSEHVLYAYLRSSVEIHYSPPVFYQWGAPVRYRNKDLRNASGLKKSGVLRIVTPMRGHPLL